MAAMLTAVRSPAATAALASLDPKAPGGKAAKAKETGQDFEQVFINSMFQQMFSGVGQGPFNGGPGASIWRSFLTDEYARSFVRSGGIASTTSHRESSARTRAMGTAPEPIATRMPTAGTGRASRHVHDTHVSTIVRVRPSRSYRFRSAV